MMSSHSHDVQVNFVVILSHPDQAINHIWWLMPTLMIIVGSFVLTHRQQSTSLDARPFHIPSQLLKVPMTCTLHESQGLFVQIQPISAEMGCRCPLLFVWYRKPALSSLLRRISSLRENPDFSSAPSEIYSRRRGNLVTSKQKLLKLYFQRH